MEGGRAALHRLALAVVAVVALVHGLQWARPFFVPLLLGIALAYMLNPVVAWLERARVPRSVGAAVATLAMLAVIVGVLWEVQGEFQAIADSLPALARKLTHAFAHDPDKPGAIAQMRAAAAEIERAANAATAGARHLAPAAPTTMPIFDWLLAGSVGLVSLGVEAAMVVFLMYFLLLASDGFKRKLVKFTGPSLSARRITVHILDDINSSIQRYLFMLLVTNALLALLMWLALRALGMDNAGAWAIFAGFLHLMPYFGPLVITLATGMAAFLQFGAGSEVLLAMGAALAISALVGSVIATWMTGRIARMSPAAVFVGLLFWGWLWGVPGLLLGVPVMVVLKVVAERVEGMETLAELLGP